MSGPSDGVRPDFRELASTGMVHFMGVGGAGMTPLATDTNGKYVTQVDVQDGQIIITFGNDANGAIDLDTLVLTPWFTADNSVAWQCAVGGQPDDAVGTIGAGGAASSIEEQYTPSNCRTGG